MTAPLRIDVVSDAMRPWRIIGWRQLARAPDRTGTQAEIRRRPFELNPDMPPKRRNPCGHAAGKRGAAPERSGQGRRHDLQPALLHARFAEGRDLSDPEAPADVAGAIGLDRDAALTVLRDQRRADEARACGILAEAGRSRRAGLRQSRLTRQTIQGLGRC